MEQHDDVSYALQKQICTLRSRLAQAYDRGDGEALRRFSREMDRIQRDLWRFPAQHTEAAAS